MKTSIYAAAGLAILGLAAIVPVANASVVSTSCISSNPYEGNPTESGWLFQPIPVGCALTNNGVPIIFTDVPDQNGVLQTVTIDDFVLLSNGPDDGHDVFLLDGTIGSTPFSVMPLTLKEIMASLTSPNDYPLASQGLGITMTDPFTGLKVDLGGGTLLDHPGIEEVEADPLTSSTYTQLVTSLGGGLYDSTLNLNFTFAMTLDGETDWVTADPTLSLENFNPANFPNLAPLLGVPEPATLALFGAGLLGMGFMHRRRAVKRAS